MKKFFSLFALSLIVLSCSKDSENPKPELSVSLDGQEWVGTAFINSMLKATDTITFISRKTLDIRVTNKDGDNIIISATDISSGLDGDCLATGDYVEIGAAAPGDTKVVLFTYTRKNTGGISAYEGFLKVTECDESNRRISGEFNFKITDPGTGNTVDFSSGTFSNLAYFISEA